MSVDSEKTPAGRKHQHEDVSLFSLSRLWYALVGAAILFGPLALPGVGMREMFLAVIGIGYGASVLAAVWGIVDGMLRLHSPRRGPKNP